MCNHFFVDGFGGMGDAVVCVKCGLCKYPEVINAELSFAKIQGNFIKNDDTYIHFEEYPYVRKFNKHIDWDIDIKTWTHAFNKKGVLVPRSEIECEIGFLCSNH